MEDLEDADALGLIRVKKTFVEPTPAIELVSGTKKQYELRSVVNNRDRFILDVSASSVVVKYTYHLRTDISITLLRLDVGGNHTNPPTSNLVLPPDDPFYGIHEQFIGYRFIKEPHIHVYRKGYGDRWAYPINLIMHGDTVTRESTLRSFLEFSNVDRIPQIQEGLDDFER